MISLTFVLISLLYKTERFHVAEEGQRTRESVVGTSVTHSAIASCATFLFLAHFDIICDQSLNH